MNSREFLTHYKGVPLKSMCRDDVIEVLQHYYRQYHTLQEAHMAVITKSGRAIAETHG